VGFLRKWDERFDIRPRIAAFFGFQAIGIDSSIIVDFPEITKKSEDFLKSDRE